VIDLRATGVLTCPVVTVWISFRPVEKVTASTTTYEPASAAVKTLSSLSEFNIMPILSRQLTGPVSDLGQPQRAGPGDRVSPI